MAEDRKTFKIKDGHLGEVKIADEVVAIIAGLAAHGVTQIEDIFYIDRGYENIVEKLTAVGADIRRVEVREETVIPKAL